MEIKKTVISIVRLIITVGFLIFLVEYIGMLYGIIVFALLFVAWTLFRKWDTFMLSMQHIESKMFGKPLDKKFWKEGEFKNRPKIKFVWRKGNE